MKVVIFLVILFFTTSCGLQEKREEPDRKMAMLEQKEK
jgi:hypothetical protein